MKLKYKIKITQPETHYLSVIISGERTANDEQLSFFIPSWSPGSYLMREYGRNIRNFKALNSTGEYYQFEQVDKGVYLVDFKNSDLKGESSKFEISYDVYCHELTVRTSHVDINHAFIHGPSVLMGILNKQILEPELEVQFPALWSKLSTGLKDISTKREVFLYGAKDYDELIDSPIEIGCQETDGFRVNGVDHELCWYGPVMKHSHNLKADIKTIVETVLKTTKDIPYEKYTFMTHFSPGLFGGLEHSNSTVLQYGSFAMTSRKDYIGWLELVAHEYFHTWNVKRIRPVELGPFDYLNEAKTKMHWLTEGLTSFMDQLFVFRAGLTTLSEYLESMVVNLNRYYATPGRRFHSLEDSSFNAWIKLYRPDENSANSSISYYLKGGLVFFALNVMLVKNNSGIDALFDLLWQRYKSNPDLGVSADEVYAMVEKLGGAQVSDKFKHMIESCEEIDFEAILKEMGIEVEYEQSDKVNLGLTPLYQGDNITIQSVVLDGVAYKCGLNAGDELIAIDGMRLNKTNFPKSENFLEVNKTYTFLVARVGVLNEVSVLCEKGPRKIKALKSSDEAQTITFLK
ncbi:M61 family metallopeptidase [Halobacteriovorax sp. HLS]|uniref:M61 family metallopeptidase n=1 Tax=Halobacteriovorax sp. HLS TaxID=2234000 RepID=UPI000FDC225E|nr:PDZ domain-containing protein [Halobacteriovorax sp. HLS]